MVATTLRRGEIAIISYEADFTTAGTGDNDALRIVLMGPIGSGTVIYISDRNWSGTAFAAAGGGDGTLTYTAASDLAAGTVLTFTRAQLTAAGITHNAGGDTLYVYQGTTADIPTTFLHALDYGDGNTTFNGNLTGTGLVAGTSAVAVGHDNASWQGSATQIYQTMFTGINTSANWYGNDLDDTGATPHYTEVIDTHVGNPGDAVPESNNDTYHAAMDMVMIAGMTGGGQSDAILRIGRDEGASVGSNLSRLFRDNPAFNRIDDLTFDIENGFFFFVDANGNATNRIMRGNIADLVSGNTNPTFTQLFITDNQNNGAGPVLTGEIIKGIEINTATNQIYWWDGNLQGDFEGGWEFYRSNYDGTGRVLICTLDSENPDPTFGIPGGIGDWALDIPRGFAYIVSSTSIIDGLGNATVGSNHILRVHLATGVITVLPLDLADPRSNTGPGGVYNNGRLEAAEGQIMALDVDQDSGIIYFITQPISSTANGGIFSYNPITDDLVELWNQPAPNAHNTLQSHPIANMTHIEYDEIADRYYVSVTSDSNHELDGSPGTNESDASIFIGNPAGGAPTRFVRVFEPVANGGPSGMEIDYAPTVTTTSLGSTYTESTNLPASPAGPTVDVNSTVVVGDVDNTVIQGATVAITTGFVAGDSLTFTNSGGITGTYNATTGVITFTGATTFANYQTVLDSVRFTNAGDNPTNYGYNPTRTISFQVFDGLAYSDPATAIVNVVGINDAPVNTAGGAAGGIFEDTTGTAGIPVPPPVPRNAITGISIFDVDADPAADTLTVTLSVQHGTLSIRTDVVGGLAPGAVAGNNSSTLVLTGTQNQINATLAAVNNAGTPAANGLVYTPVANYNGADTLTILTDDQGNNGNDPGITGTGTSESDSDTKTINITNVNDAPTVTDATQEAATIAEDTPSAAGQTIASLFTASFSDALDQQQVAITNPTGSLANTLAGIAVVGNDTSGATGRWQYFNGTWQDIPGGSLNSAFLLPAGTAIRFNPALNYNGPATTLTVLLVDSSGSSIAAGGETVNLSGVGATGGTTRYSAATVTLSQTITAVNDAPVNTVPGTLNLSEDAVAIPVSGIQVTDVEAGPAGEPLTVTLSVARGTITINTGIAGGIDATHVSGGAAAATNATSITITATQAQINATLAGANGLTYTPTAEVNGNDTLTIVTSDLGYVGAGGVLTDTDMRTLNVGAVNDAPTVGDGTEDVPAINEGTPNTNVTAQTVAQLFGPQFSDATDQVAGGSSANTLLGIAIVANGSNANGTWEWLNGGVWTAIGAATQAAAKTFTAATQIRFNPATDFNGTAPTLTAHLVDNSSGSITNGNTVNLSGVGATGGTTRYSSGTVVLSQEVTAVNDGPANTVPGPLTINEDATNVAVTGIQVADVEAGPASQPLTVTLTVAHGTLHVDTTNVSGVGPGDVTGNDSASVTVTGTQAEINATLAGLNGLTYTPTAHFNGADSLQIVTSDAGYTGTGGTLMDSDAVTINITAINDAPTVSGDGTENAAAIPQDTPSATGQTVSSLFSPQYSDAADNQVPNGGASSPGAFGGIAVVDNGSSGATGQWQYLDGVTWTDIGPATTAAAQLFDAGTFIRFNPATGFSGAAPTLTVHLIDNSLGAFNDGDDANLTGATGGTTPYSTGQVVLSQQVTGSNIAPVVDLNDGTGGLDDTNIFAEGTSGSGLGTSIAVSDADAGDMIEGATITLTDPAAGDELIANLPLPGGITISGASTATTIILTGTASADDYEAALGQLGYRNTGNDPTVGGTDTSRSITVTVTDGTANSALATMTITVFGENDEPTLAATGDNPTFSEGGAAVDLFDPVSASTVEAGQTFTSMTLTVSSVTEGANEILSFDGSDVALTNGSSVVGTTTNGLTVNVTVAGNTATVTFSGAALNAASLQTLVDTLTYRNTSENPTDADRAVTITELVDSGSNTSPNDNIAALGIVSTVNVNPVNDAASITGIASGDVTEAGGTNNATAGTPTATADLNSTDIDNPNDTWQPVLAGTPSIGGYGTYAVNASGVWTYTLDDNDPAVQALFGAATLSDTFNVTTADGTAQLVTITIHAKDDFPTAQPDTVTTDEGTILNGNVLDNNGSGPDSDPDSGITVSEVEGQPAGSAVVLDSGALLTVNTDGTFSYDPNGMFDETPTPGSGAVNTPATDTFDYTLTNGNTVTVTVLITGLDTDDVLIGSAGDDVLDAGVGNDILVGLAGADEMSGGIGDDQYYVDDSGDVVIEQSAGGFDIVYAGANFALQDGEEVEILSAVSLGDTAPLHLSGNDLDQEILGNAGANVIRGGGGTDVLAGQDGDDEYYVTEGNERIIEVAGGGRDVVYTSVSYALTPGTTQVEVLSALSIGGTDPLNLTGNEFVQQILGNEGANVLRGGGGADALVGYGGDDDYYVTDGGETVHEAAGDGTDVVYASVDYVLRDGAEVEVLSTVALGGTDAIDLTGNDFANTLLGNAGDNVLNGGLGADTLVGFGGADTFSFTTSLGGGNVDFILDFVSGTDTIELAASLFAGLTAGAPLGTAFALGSAQGAEDRIIYDQASGGLYYDADGNGDGAAVQFATLNAGTVLTANDFSVI